MAAYTKQYKEICGKCSEHGHYNRKCPQNEGNDFKFHVENNKKGATGRLIRGAFLRHACFDEGGVVVANTRSGIELRTSYARIPTYTTAVGLSSNLVIFQDSKIKLYCLLLPSLILRTAVDINKG